MKKINFKVALIFAAMTSVSLLAIWFAPNTILCIIGCWQIGTWCGSISSKIVKKYAN